MPYKLPILTPARRKIKREPDPTRAEEIAKERNLAVSTIYEHMHHLVVNGYLSSKEFISEDKLNQILEAQKKFPNAAKLKELKQALPESVSYNEIKCVLADKTLEAKNT